MKLTVYELVNKVDNLESIIDEFDQKSIPDMDILINAKEYLEEYRDLIMAAKVEI